MTVLLGSVFRMASCYTRAMNERRGRILDLVAETYIHSARPVPSALIARQLNVSSATVRNELGALEEEGYVHQPHTSAGRVPTRLGYSRYARKFIPPQRLPESRRRLIEAQLKDAHGDLLLQQVARVAAELSGYAVVVSLPADDELYALEIHLSALSSSKLLAVVILETGLLRQLIVDLDPTPSDEVLRDAESSLRQLTVPIGKVPEALRDIAKRSPDDVARTFEALLRCWPSMVAARRFQQGLSNVLAEPESADPQFVRSVIERLEHPPDARRDDTPFVIVFEEALALVSAPLPLGTGRAELWLLGPIRMRYPEVLTIAHGVSEAVAQSFHREAGAGLN
jgi:heat-inducible transcriptional repressor